MLMSHPWSKKSWWEHHSTRPLSSTAGIIAPIHLALIRTTIPVDQVILYNNELDYE